MKVTIVQAFIVSRICFKIQKKKKEKETGRVDET